MMVYILNKILKPNIIIFIVSILLFFVGFMAYYQIDTRPKFFCNVLENIPGTNIVAKGDGINNDHPAIQAAIRLCPPNHFIFIPSGTYSMSTNSISLKNKKNIIIRGQGTNTILRFTHTKYFSSDIGYICKNWNVVCRYYIPYDRNDPKYRGDKFDSVVYLMDSYDIRKFVNFKDDYFILPEIQSELTFIKSIYKIY